MNTTLQMNPAQIAQTKPAVRNVLENLRIFAVLIQAFNQTFNYRDDLAAVHYAESKYGEGRD